MFVPPRWFVELSACVLVAGLGWWLWQRSDPRPAPTDCTCRQLHDAPALFAGKVVRVPTAGTQPHPDGLAWRPYADSPPAVVLTGRVGGPPPFVRGVCHAPLAGGPVRVTGCEPCP